MRRDVYEQNFCWLGDFFKQVARTAVSTPPPTKLVGSRSKHRVKVRAVDLHIIGGLRTSGFLKLPKLVAWGVLEACFVPKCFYSQNV